jgi:TPP-dependent 2-oxoacid decarboxylase
MSRDAFEIDDSGAAWRAKSMKIGEYLIRAIQQTGVEHVFGIQGDYVLNFYSQLCQSPLSVINTCDEQGAGFAADAYARVTGLGVVCVTYGAGGLKVVNTTAQAFAERSPVLVISGAPGISERKGDPLLHHKVRSFETQLNVFREMTVAQAVLDNAKTAATEINRVIDAVKKTKRPGYIELPRDMVDIEAEDPEPPSTDFAYVDQKVIGEALREVVGMLLSAQRPIVMAGVEVHRFGLQNLLLEFLDRSGLPFTTGVLGKSVISENHPQFIGVYVGAMSPDDVRETVEEADCAIVIGPLITDLSTGIFTHQIDTDRLIVMTPENLHVQHHTYPGIGIEPFLKALIAAFPESIRGGRTFKRHVLPPFVPEKGRVITMERLVMAINSFLDDNTTLIAEAGDPLFGALDIRVHRMSEFLSTAYYASLGFGVPAAMAVQFASPDRRPLALVGDGSFQMTGMELSTAVRYGLSPVIVLLNNGGYGTFRPMIDGAFNDIQPWRYADIPRIIGAGQGYAVLTEEELAAALEHAKKNSTSPTVIEVKIDKNDFSARLKGLTSKLKKSVRA